ncbi:MAG: putative O-glycosylation ligase, exosortase A system-associated [Halofilum sp. (in: g-proteobacteria)]|nr:putative O-glycosylation ligase, exosortase A system-associated [Halofilum sp. (in: g-proteobacteria)]
MARDRKSVPFTTEVVLMCAMAAWFTVTTYFAWVQDSAWNYWEQFMKVLLFALLTPVLIHGRVRTEWLVIVVTGSLAFYGLKGGWFTVTTGGQSHVLGPPRSFISGNTNLGLAMLMVMPLTLVLARQLVQGRLACLPHNAWTRLAGWGSYLTFYLTGIAAVFTYSRGALVGLAAIAPFLFAKMRHKLALVLLAVLAVTAIGITVPDKLVNRAETIQTYEEDGSAMSRLQAWDVAFHIALENPLTGGGFRLSGIGTEQWLSYTDIRGFWTNSARAAHSNYFQVLGEHGFAGLTLYLGLLGSVCLALLRLARRAKAMAETVWISEYAWGILVGIIAYAVAGAFLDMAYFTLFYAFVALTIVLRREYEQALAAQPEAEHATGGSSGTTVGQGAPGQAMRSARSDPYGRA